MSQGGTAPPRRSFGRIEAGRLVIDLSLLAAVCVGSYFLLPLIQRLVIPSSPVGSAGPWIVRPIFAFHVGAAAGCAVVAVPLLTTSLRRKQRAEDASLGTAYDPLRNRPIKKTKLMVQGFFYGLIYIAAILFYCGTWTSIDRDGIRLHVMGHVTLYPYSTIAGLEEIPPGYRSESLTRNGPWYEISFPGDHVIHLSDESEGMEMNELQSIANHIANQSGLIWHIRSDAIKRRQ